MSISYSFRIRCSTFFCCPSLLFELTSFLKLRFLSFSSSSILFSRFGSYRTSSERLGVRGIYKLCYLFGFKIGSSSCTFLRLLYSSLRPTWSTVQIVFSIPTSSILPSQDLMSTTFFKLFLQNLK